jgi:hypothetical protein
VAFSAAGRSRPERRPSVRRPCEAMSSSASSRFSAPVFGASRPLSSHNSLDRCCIRPPSVPDRPLPSGACLTCEPRDIRTKISPAQGAGETPVGEVGDAAEAGREWPQCMCNLGSINSFRVPRAISLPG